MDHYYSNPLSILTNVDLKSTKVKRILDMLDDRDLLQIQMLPSFKR